MIVVFSGTGNSRYVADYLAELLQDEVCDAASYIKERKAVRLSSSRPWIFISPVYVSAPPLIFLKFLEKSVFSGSSSAYFINTCAGGMGASPYYNKKLASKKHMTYMGTCQIKMPQNYLIYFQTKPEKEASAIVKTASFPIRRLASLIRKGKPFDDPDAKIWEVLATKLILKFYYRHFIKAKNFTVTDKCIGCGKCVRVCPLSNIRLDNKHPKWENHCTHCMACINSCPVQAVEYGNFSAGKPRYMCKPYHQS